MMNYIALIFMSLVFIGCTVHPKPKPQLDECSKLAEGTPRSEQGFMGVPFEKIDAEKAIAACSKQLDADPSNPHVQFLFARALTKNHEFEKAFDLLKQSCAAGDEAGCTLMGGFYDNGFPPVKHDRSKAHSIYEKACEHKELSGCLNASVEYIYGPGDMRDVKRGEELMFKTCQEGFYAACMYYSNAAYFKKIAADEDRYLYAATRECEAGLECFVFWEKFGKKKDEESLKKQFEVLGGSVFKTLRL